MPDLKPHPALVTIDTPLAPPRWALLQRQFLKVQAEACAEFYDKYFDERGYLECVPRWGGDDGPDDANQRRFGKENAEDLRRAYSHRAQDADCSHRAARL